MKMIRTRIPNPPEPAERISIVPAGETSVSEEGDVGPRFHGIGQPEKSKTVQNPIGNPREVTVTYGSLNTRFGGAIT